MRDGHLTRLEQGQVRSYELLMDMHMEFIEDTASQSEVDKQISKMQQQIESLRRQREPVPERPGPRIGDRAGVLVGGMVESKGGVIWMEEIEEDTRGEDMTEGQR